MTTYTLTVQQDTAELDFLRKNGFQLALAKQVFNGNTGTSTNFKSHALDSQIEIAWTTKFALNWSHEIPAAGKPLTVAGNWQACAFGEAYTLASPGIWQPDREGGKAGVLSVRNAFRPVSFVVGVQDPKTSRYSPIYISSRLTPPDGAEEIEPKESIELWFESEQDDGLITTTKRTRSVKYNMNNAREQDYKRWFRWSSKDGWVEKDRPFRA
ncbi:hypothetical protein Micbo1qcDRAFT_197593 [Microdochium bolleyi]|uniref:Uncharacterized protein n=1 Tax=Microdochium bolleyi TaxID=196109 RepID=A0A136IT09_9PEZI|nr:hypothetical protein Micbo1qcDRAFT_197593 [Microdochium bolleyi]